MSLTAITKRFPAILAALGFILLIGAAAACGGSSDSAAPTPAGREGPARDAQEIKIGRAGAVLASIPGQSTPCPDNLFTAAQLQERLQDPAEAEKIFLLDTRPRAEWESQGHIEGALWMNMQDVADPANLEQLPRDKLIICISPTGHTAAQVASVLRWLGFNAGVLEFGMSGWTDVPARQIIIADVTNGVARRYPVAKETPGSQAIPQEALQELAPPAQEELEVLTAAAQSLLKDDVFDKEYPFNHIFADELYRRLADPGLNRSIFLLDIRPLGEWEQIGHISLSPHAHIDWRILGQPENLAQLPKDKLIVVVGATGQTAGQVTPVLRMLGYDAVSLRSGMTSWTETADSARTLDQINSADFPVAE